MSKRPPKKASKAAPRQEKIGARVGTWAMVQAIAAHISEQTGVPVSGAVALEIAVREALDRRQGKRTKTDQ